MDNSFKKIFIAMLGILVVAAICVAGLYVRSLDKRANTTEETSAVTETETEIPIITLAPVSNPIQTKREQGGQLLDTDNVRTIVLRSKDESLGNFRYELFVNNGNITFTGWYEGEEGDVRCSDQPINATRLKDVSNIIEKYTVVKDIENYMSNPEGSKLEGKAESGLEITFSDGHHADFGFPNGAGKDLAKYFKSLTEWLSTLE